MSLTGKNVSGVPLIAFTAVSYVCASCLSLSAVPAPPVRSGADGFLLISWGSPGGKPGQGVQEGGEAKKVVPGQRQELDFSGLLNANGDGRLLVQAVHLWEATGQQQQGAPSW